MKLNNLESWSVICLQCAQVVLMGVGLYKGWYQDWAGIFVVVQAMALSALPYILEKKFGIHIPHVLRIGIILFIFSTLILGEIGDFYNTYHWWDIVLHGVASSGLTLIGFILLLLFFKRSELKSKTLLSSCLAVSFALALAVVWEVYEFLVDQLITLDTPMQPSNTDTMTDLIISIVGALVVAVGGYRYISKREKGVVGQIIEEAVVNNSVA